MLAYCSVLHEGYAAGSDTPGVAPLRAHTRYEPVDYQPGVPPCVVTTPDEEDLADLVADLRADTSWQLAYEDDLAVVFSRAPLTEPFFSSSCLRASNVQDRCSNT